MAKNKLKLSLPPGNAGEFILTPGIARRTGAHALDLERLVKKRAEKLGEDLWMKLTVVSEGMKVTWGPGSEVEIDEESEVSNFESLDPEQVVSDELWEYLEERHDALMPEDHDLEPEEEEE